MILERMSAEKSSRFIPKSLPNVFQSPLFPSLKQPQKKLTSPTIEKATHYFVVRG